MPIGRAYRAQADLLIRSLPSVARLREFALKGGTAINLFRQDMPRLSVDIDLTFLPITDRRSALDAIRTGLVTIAENVRRTIPGARVQQTAGEAPRLLIGAMSGARIKVEPNTVIRGSLYPPVRSALCPAAQDEYDLFVRVQRLADGDLYGGKLCAALDRQHPRDLFDVKPLFEAEAVPDEIRRAFVVYLASHRRPMAELLAPRRKPIRDLFIHHFSGMTAKPIDLDALEITRSRLFAWAATALVVDERRFLLSIKRGDPEWSRLPFPDLDRWPALRWKVRNIRKMAARDHERALRRLRAVLDV